MSTKFVYAFSEGDATKKDLLGGKGAGLAEMVNIGLPVPPGITVTTQACMDYYKKGEEISEEIKKQIFVYLEKLEDLTGKKFGGDKNPLLVSARSGAKISMPGMMDTILNLGLNSVTVEALAKETNNRRFAFDSYRRFIMMFSDVALNIDRNLFENELDKIKHEKRYDYDTQLTEDDLVELCGVYKGIYKDKIKKDFPDDPKEQLMVAVEAVFKSWNNHRAITYRKLNSIPHTIGTAVNIQAMVYGNMGNDSGTGVAFTRNPATGEKKVFGEYLINAQGEDVVAGIRTPEPMERLKTDMPNIYNQFIECAAILEAHFKDMQDIEFTIENGKLYFLQTRNGKRTAAAALQAAVDMVNEGLIDKETALLRIDAASLTQLMYPAFTENAIKKAELLVKGLPASPGAATGKLYFSAEDIKKHAEAGEAVILVRKETSPEDIDGMNKAKGIVTAHGGMTSHAAVVARGMGKCCVAGCEQMDVNESEKYFEVRGKKIKEGDCISVDGTTGTVYTGILETESVHLSDNFKTIMEWSDAVRRLRVRANADTPTDAAVALKFGAEGIGLCRTEHMFFKPERILEMRKMICSDSIKSRKEALNKLLPMQTGDFEAIYKVMDGKYVTVRLLDPPLHEFLPKEDKDIKQIAGELGIREDMLRARIDELHEFNPMLGHRGCRLSITYPEIAQMQSRAIITAAINAKRAGIKVLPEIMIPLVGNKKELDYVMDIIRDTVNCVFEEEQEKVDYLLGTMIEIPRAALTSGDIAQSAEFFSFGTNDLTQMTLGFSRDDAGRFINDYMDKNIFDDDPFQTVDQIGVGRLIKISVEEGRKTRKDLHCGVCGEHGGDPRSIYFFESVGLDYVSCSPYRVPIARLAAAQAALKNKNA